MSFDPSSPLITMGGKIVQISSSPVYLKITRHNKTSDKDEEKYWLEQFMSKDAAQKVISGEFKDGDEINFTIDKTKRFDGGYQLLTDISPKKQSSFRHPFQQADPARDRRIVRQSSLDRSVELWISLKPADKKELTEEALKSILTIAERFEEWVMRE
jgi:hypothetical protein